jgi:mono/diheme cytochrome c family protein
MSRATLALLFLVCGTARCVDADEAPLTATQEQGKRLFHSTCVYCHGERVWGTFALAQRLGPNRALLEKRNDLVAGYLKTVMRTGIGGMPSYRRTELSEADADAIASYLTRLNPRK